jgi:predicted TIM-barrel fold metal-dependent hydrolase
MYRFDASYALQVRAAHPGRFALIKPLDATDPKVADVVAEWAALDGTVAVRIMLNRGVSTDPADPGITRIATAAAKHSMPLNLLCWGRLDQVHEIIARNPDTMFVIDHLGLQQPFEPPPLPQPFAELPKVLKFAAFKNVAIKISGACTLSQKPYPYPDIWDPLARIFDAFGMDRCMWGTDWTRAVELLTYKQGVDPFRLTDRLTDSDRAQLMGGTLQKVYGWAPTKR